MAQSSNERMSTDQLYDNMRPATLARIWVELGHAIPLNTIEQHNCWSVLVALVGLDTAIELGKQAELKYKQGD